MSDHVSSARSDAPRRVDLAIARIDAWTVMKVSFLLSVALGIAMVVATIVLWLMVDAMHVFSQLEEFLQTVGAGRFVDLLDYARLPRVISYATIVPSSTSSCSPPCRRWEPCSTTSSPLWWAASRCPSWTSEGTRARGRLAPAPFAIPSCAVLCFAVWPHGCSGCCRCSGCRRVRPPVMRRVPVVAPVPSALVVPVVVSWLAPTLPCVRYKILPAWVRGGESGTKLAPHA